MGFSFLDGRVELHGYVQSTARALSDNYGSNYWYQSQWANVLNLESDVAIAPDGWGPFDLVSAFARVEVRYECVYWGCGTTSYRHFGNRSSHGPARNWTNGHTTGLTGLAPTPQGQVYIHGPGGGTALLGLLDNPLLDALRDFGGTNLEATFAPVLDDAFVFKETYGTLASSNTMLGPWRPESTVRPNAALAEVSDPTLSLPMRPPAPSPGESPRIRQGAVGLYIPSAASRDSLNRDDYGSLDLNFSQSDLEWNHGAGQDENELKEAYLEFEMFDSRLWVRAGKQNIVWGKTELFRTTDQFNPQDIALASLSSLEESRLALWSLRGVWSLYDVGPLEDVRVELAMNYDEFEPIDLGTCGEPYTPWLVCGKSVGAFAHGVTGLGLVGETRPPDPWEDTSGIELGARIEWRWNRFSFALTDFWGYSDTPYLSSIGFYERAVDLQTGRPLAALSTGRCDPDGLFGPPDSSGCLVAVDPTNPPGPHDPGFENNALDFHPSNRQLFDQVCSATVGVASTISDLLAPRCLVDVVNDTSISILSIATGIPIPITDPLTQGTFSGFFSNLFVGNTVAASLAGQIGGNATYIPLNQDPGDLMAANCNDAPVNCFYAFSPVNNGTNPILHPTLNLVLTPEQQALLGCGPFYGTNCEVDGIDLFNSEGSVLVQSFPQTEPDPPVATRFDPASGQVVILPGARGPGDAAYDPLVDGCVAPPGTLPGDGACLPTAHELRNPLTGELFKNELGALSWNFMLFLASLSLPSPECLANKDDCAPNEDPGCNLTTAQGLIACAAERAASAVTGTQRPELRAAGNGRFGRRDWIWQGGGEARLRYHKQNVLGFSMDFAEDLTKTNWGLEFTWFDDAFTGSNRDESLHQSADFFNLTISVDRPTFVNFLNPNRTFFLNSQWFIGYIQGFNGSFPGNGPVNVLATFTATTGYFQDRLLPSMTFVHDFRSRSGGAIVQVGYRFTENFSASFGIATFYGQPQNQPIARYQLGLANNGGDFKAQTAYNGLSAISERDEIFASLRYTF